MATANALTKAIWDENKKELKEKKYEKNKTI